MQDLRVTEQIHAGGAEHAGCATEHPTSEDGHESTVSARTSQHRSLIDYGQTLETEPHLSGGVEHSPGSVVHGIPLVS